MSGGVHPDLPHRFRTTSCITYPFESAGRNLDLKAFLHQRDDHWQLRARRHRRLYDSLSGDHGHRQRVRGPVINRGRAYPHDAYSETESTGAQLSCDPTPTSLAREPISRSSIRTAVLCAR